MATKAELGTWVQGPKAAGYPLLLSQVYQQAGGLEVEQTELRLVPLWDAAFTDSNLTHCTTMLIPDFAKISK